MPLKIFISYTQADRHWAEWIAWQAEAAEHAVMLQAWDFREGSNFVALMDKALQWADVTMPVLSPAFFRSAFGKAEWTSAFASDPLGHDGRLIPVKVRDCEIRGLLAPIIRIELVGLEKAEAVRRLVGGLKKGRRKPEVEPAYPPDLGGARAAPAAEPDFPRTRMIGVPHRNKFFTGREELLAELHKRLQEDDSAVLAQAAIHGLGGIGKTQTAIEYAHRYGGEYRAVLWVAAEDVTAIGTSYSTIAQRLELVEEGAKLEAVVLAVKGWFSREAGWLLIFDNADDPEILREYLPASRAGGKVLLTSRASTFSTVGITDPFRVQTLEPDDAMRFLIKRTKRDEPDAARELAEELGFLPLALEQAAAYLETVRVSFTDYLKSYKTRGLRLLEKCRVSTDYPESVATTWSLSIERVREESPASAELLNATAFLVPDSIPIEIFTLGGAKFGGELAKALDRADEDPLVFLELLAPLERYSLVERIEGSAFKLHRLTQKVVGSSLGGEQQVWAARVVEALSAIYPNPKFENWPACERFQSSAFGAFRHIEEQSVQSKAAALLLSRAGYYASKRGDLQGPLHLHQKAQEIYRRVLGPEHPDTPRSMNNLALALLAVGDYAGAREMQEQALEIKRSIMGAEHPNTLTSMNNLAETLRVLGDLARARRMQEQVLKIRKRVLGIEHPDTLSSMNNLGLVLYSVRDFAGARQIHEQSLSIKRRVLNAEHPDTLATMTNLASTLWALGDLAGARQMHEQALEILKRVLGVEHPSTLTSMHNLASTLRDLGNLASARQMFEQILEVRERVLGLEHSQTTNSAWNLLLIIRRLGDAGAEPQLIGKLRWLLAHDEDDLASAKQREIRQNLIKLLASPTTPLVPDSK